MFTAPLLRRSTPPRRRRLTAVAAGTAIMLVLPAAAQASAPAGPRRTGLGIRLLDAPVNLLRDPRAHVEIIDVLRPGTTIVRQVQITNDTGHSARILIYPDAATITRGTFVPGPGGATDELTTWIHVTPAAVTLPNTGVVTATVTIHVPVGVTNGERYAAILAELPPRALASGVALESRVGVRVYLYVDRSGTPVTTFTIRSLTALRLTNGVPQVRALVDDTGQRAINLSGALTLSNGPGGTSAGPFPVRLGTSLAPGQTEPAVVDLPKNIPNGPWLARIRVTSGLHTREAQALITFPSQPGRAALAVRAIPVPLLHRRPLLLLVAGGLVLLLLLALLLLAWRRRRSPDDPPAGPGGAPPGIPAARAARDRVETPVRCLTTGPGSSSHR